MKVPFNKPYTSGREAALLLEVLKSGNTGSGRMYYQKCKAYLESEFDFPFVGMTKNCTAALELSAQLLELGPGDEVILPSYAYVTTVNAFARFGVELKFADSLPDHPNIDPNEIERLISPKTKAIVVLHYSGSCCDMDAIMEIAGAHGIPVVEDAAHALGEKWKDKYAGSFGDFGAISFHETKNIQCGEGGALIVNRPAWVEKVQTFLEHGTNRMAFEKVEVERYEWTAIGSSIKPSELNMAMLWGQIEDYQKVAIRQLEIAKAYSNGLSDLEAKGLISFLKDDPNCSANGHIFAIVLESEAKRKALEQHLSAEGISAYLHFGALHASPFFKEKYKSKELKNGLRFAEGLLRLPVFLKLKYPLQEKVIGQILNNYCFH